MEEKQARTALEEGHGGDIRGALGTIRRGDVAPRHTWRGRWQTFLAILGPGLIVMVGDNDAGALSTYAQSGQNYGYDIEHRDQEDQRPQ